MEQIKTYFLKNNVNNLVKIGKSNDVERRRKEMIKQISFVELSVFHVIEGNYESYFHQHYKEFRKEGEWFDLPNITIDEIHDKLSQYKPPPSKSLQETTFGNDSNDSEIPYSVEFNFLEKHGYCLHYFVFVQTTIYLYEETGAEIIKKMTEIDEEILFIIVRSGSSSTYINKTGYHKVEIGNTTDCLAQIEVVTPTKNRKFTIMEVIEDDETTDANDRVA